MGPSGKPRDIPKISPRCHQDIPKISQRYPQDTVGEEDAKVGEECFLSAAFWEITKSTGERQLPLSWQNTHKFHIKLLLKVRQYNPPLLSHVSTDLRWGRKGRTAQMQGRVVLYNSSFILCQTVPFSCPSSSIPDLGQSVPL